MKRIFLLVAIITTVLVTLFSACNKKPTAPKADNPFDPANVQTSGDPFKLTARIANGGILLQWTKPPMKNLKAFNIYRSEQEKGTYKKIKNISANTTNYTDTNIENGHSYWYVVTAVNDKDQESSRTNLAPVNIKTQPVLVINGGDQYTPTRAVQLTILANTATQMMLSNQADFSGAQWEAYVTSKSWELPTGDGEKTVYLKVKYENGQESQPVSAAIKPQPMNPSIVIIADTVEYTPTRNVTLKLSATGANLKMKLSEDSTFSGVQWQNYQSNPAFQLSTGNGTKKVYAKFKNDFEIESDLVFDTIEPQPMNPSISIANNAQYTTTRNVQLNLNATGSNLKMKLSEDSTFNGVNWQDYSSDLSFILSTGDGVKKVYAKFKNDFEIESSTLKDDIIMDTTPPTVVLTVTPDSGITNETTFQFDPTGSSDNLTAKQDLRVRFDWENDGMFDTNWHELRITKYEFQVGGGDKTVRMQLKDGVGWQVETTKNIFVNTRPQAAFTATKDNDNYRMYHFDASASTDYEDGHNLQYRWDFDGDGVYDTNWLTQDNISHVFDHDGTYQTQLSVRDENQLIGQKISEIQVQAPLVDMVFVQGGTFQMGDTWGDGDSDERPVHTVTVSSFYMGKYEVTNAQVVEVFNWALQQGKITASSTTVENTEGNAQELLDLDGSLSQISYNGSVLYVENNYDNYPVVEISWYGAAAFCNYLSEREGLTPVYDLSNWTANWNANGYRLPTEAEWEYAAKGGANGNNTKYSGSDNVYDVAWYKYNSGNHTHEVGTKQANELGIYDMSGNVWEWCWDWFGFYSSDSQTDPKGPAGGSKRVLRSGCWSLDAWYVRLAYRNYGSPSDNGGIGFRLLRTK